MVDEEVVAAAEDEARWFGSAETLGGFEKEGEKGGGG